MNARIIVDPEVEKRESGISRLFNFLANKRQYPVPIRAAACISGLSEKTIAGILGNTRQFLGYQVYGNYIYLKEDLTPIPLVRGDW